LELVQNNPKALMANAYLLFSGNLPRDFARANKYLAQVSSLKYARAIYLQGLLEKYQKGLSQFNAKSERLVNDAAVIRPINEVITHKIIFIFLMYTLL